MQYNFLSFIISGILFFHSVSLFCQTSKPEIFLVPVTSKPSPQLRLQFTYENDSVQIYGADLAALPLGLKKSKFVNPKTKLNFDFTTKAATSTIENNYSLQKDTALGFQSKLTGQSYYNVLKTSFLSGKGNSPIFVNQNIRLGGFPAPSSWPQNFSANVSGAGVYTVNYLPAVSLNSLPIYDPLNCEDMITKFIQDRAKQGYGLDKLTYKPYNARKRATERKSFDIFFESNSTQPKANEIKTITDYLEKNNYEILNATMEGGSSVEGDETRNKKLQQDRARVISAALSRFNKSAVKKDTILLSDNWPKFREQIKASKYAWLDTLSNKKILEQINNNDKLRNDLEPILKTQRKASLNLTMAKTLTADDQFVTLKRSLNAWLKVQTTAKTPNKEIDQQILGGIAYLFEQHVNDVLSNEEVDSLLDGDYQDQKYSYLGLHIVKQFIEYKLGPEDKSGWQTKWNALELEPWFKRAQESLINLADNASKIDLPKYLKMQVDLQAFSYRLINLGVLDINYLCQHPYPDKPGYTSFIFNQYAFLYEMANERQIQATCITSRKKITGIEMERLTVSDSSQQLNLDSTSYANSLEDTIYYTFNSELIKTGFVKRNYKKPSFDNSNKGAYYYILKQGFLKGNRGNGNATQDALSLFHLVDISITNWKPEENFFFDRDIRLEEMDAWIAALKKGNSVCTPIINTLYMNYHTKALRYLELYFEPGSAKHKTIADASLKYITEYYKARLTRMPENSPLKIAFYLNRFNWFPGANEGARFGYDLINSITKKRKLTEPEMKLWAHYLKLYDSDLKNPLPAGYSKDNLLTVMSSSY